MAGGHVPADEVAGDAHDDSLNEETSRLPVTDAMGHDVDATLTATLLIDASRKARRAGTGLAEQAGQIRRALLDHGRHTYATGRRTRGGTDLRDTESAIAARRP